MKAILGLVMLVILAFLFFAWVVLGSGTMFILAYILVHAFMALSLGFGVTRQMFNRGRLSLTPTVLKQVFRIVGPVWVIIVAGLIVDGVTGLHLLTNPFSFVVSIFAVIYLLRRNRSQQSAGSNFRAGTMETGSSAAVVGDARKAPVRDYSGVVEDAHLINAPVAPVMPAMPNTRPLTEPVTLSKPAAPTSGPKPRDYSDLED